MKGKIKQTLHNLNRRDIKTFSKLGKYFKPFFVILIVILSIFVTKTILADEPVTDPDTRQEESFPSETKQQFKDKQDAMDEGDNQESWMNESASSNAMVGVNAGVGEVPEDVLAGKQTNWIPGGLIGMTNHYIGMVYNIPVSGVEYIAHVKDNFLGKPTYAASGFEGLRPTIKLWKGFRNAVYILFSLVFVAMGLMIMLRVKISPQATLTIQSSIPKLITSLILVTFSYAIAGLLIDLTYVIAGLGASIIYSAIGETNLNAVPVGTGFGGQKIMKLSELINNPGYLGRLWAISTPATLGVIIGAIIAGALALAGPGGWIMGLFALLLAVLAAIVFVFIQLFKFLGGLIKCYLNVLLRVIFAPLEIGLGAIPNLKIGFGTWFKNIAANLAVFPICFIFLILIEKLMVEINNNVNIWTPPGLDILGGNSGLDWLNIQGSFMSMIVGLAGLMLIAKLPKLIPEAIFQIKPSPFGQAMGAAAAPLAALAGKGAKGAGRAGVGKVGEKMAKAPIDTRTQQPVTNPTKMQQRKMQFGKGIQNLVKK